MEISDGNRGDESAFVTRFDASCFRRSRNRYDTAGLDRLGNRARISQYLGWSVAAVRAVTSLIAAGLPPQRLSEPGLKFLARAGLHWRETNRSLLMLWTVAAGGME
jgi:hypothetical protein